MKTLSARAAGGATTSQLGAADREALIALGCRPVELDLLGAPPHIRHDASKLARAVVDLALEGAAR